MEVFVNIILEMHKFEVYYWINKHHPDVFKSTLDNPCPKLLKIVIKYDSFNNSSVNSFHFSNLKNAYKNKDHEISFYTTKYVPLRALNFTCILINWYIKNN